MHSNDWGACASGASWPTCFHQQFNDLNMTIAGSTVQGRLLVCFEEVKVRLVLLATFVRLTKAAVEQRAYQEHSDHISTPVLRGQV